MISMLFEWSSMINSGDHDDMLDTFHSCRKFSAVQHRSYHALQWLSFLNGKGKYFDYGTKVRLKLQLIAFRQESKV